MSEPIRLPALTESAEQQPTEEQIIGNCKPDALYVHPTKGEDGKFLNYHIDDKGGEFDLSPRVRLGLYYVNKDEDVSSFRIVKIKKQKGSWIPEKESEVSFSGFTLAKIKEFLEFLTQLDIPSVSKGRIELLDSVGDDPELLKKLLTIVSTAKGKEAMIKLIEEGIADEDFVNLAYRKNQLQIFEKLLSQDGFLEQYKIDNEVKKAGAEAAWQHFFEKNPWIFGYGLNYIWCDGADDQKLEQVVSGFDFNSDGKRTDALLKSAGAIKQFILVEIKTPEADLIDSRDYGRPSVFLPGYEVIGGIAQSQKTVCKFKEKFFDKTGLKDDQGNPKGEVIYNFNPRSYLIIGNLKQFFTQHGINDEKYSSFELYRSSISNPEIITFDELFERAKSIVQSKPK